MVVFRHCLFVNLLLVVALFAKLLFTCCVGLCMICLVVSCDDLGFIVFDCLRVNLFMGR